MQNYTVQKMYMFTFCLQMRWSTLTQRLSSSKNDGPDLKESDKRPSAMAIGFIGWIAIMAVALLIFVPDVPKLYREVRNALSAVKVYVKKRFKNREQKTKNKTT